VAKTPFAPANKTFLSSPAEPSCLPVLVAKTPFAPANKNSSIFRFKSPTYSVLKLFAGLASAAFVEWIITVITAVTTITKADKINGITDNPGL
jgi:hypothetical protein